MRPCDSARSGWRRWSTPSGSTSASPENTAHAASSRLWNVVDRPHLDGAEFGKRDLAAYLHRLVKIPRLDHDEAKQLFLGFGKRTVGDHDLAATAAQALRFLHRLQRLSDDQMAAL